MASQTEHVTKTTPTPPKGNLGTSLGDTSPSIQTNRFQIYLIVTEVLAILGIVGVVAWMILSTKSAKPPVDRALTSILYADNKPLWDSLAPIVVQEDGRKKPLEEAARTAVRSITGREKFEGKDPLPVYFSWWLLYDHKEGDPRKEDTGANEALAQELNTDWENHPFILCEYQPLRKKIYEEYFENHKGESPKGGEPDPKFRMTEEEWLYGKHMPPAVLRESVEIQEISKTASEEKDGGEAAPLTELEEKARDVARRVQSYDRIRQSTYFGVVSLNERDPGWENLAVLKLYIKSEKDGDKPAMWDRQIRIARARAPENFQDPAKVKAMPKADPVDRMFPPQQFPLERAESVVNAFEEMKQAYRSKDPAQFQAKAQAFVAARTEAAKGLGASPVTERDQVLAQRELTLEKVKPFRWSWVLGLLASILLGAHLVARTHAEKLGRILYYSGLGVQVIALGLATFGFYCRVSISGRPPISNMYESVIWVAFMTAIFGLILELIYRKGFIGLAASLVSTLGFVLASILPVTMGQNIEPLQPVLRDGYWLIVHVCTIVSSYAAFALAWGLGNLNIGLIVYSPQNKKLIKTLSQFCYASIQIGVILLFFGTMLGGFWAAESWGRFWGWDAKEVWALIAFLCYIIPLHARYTGWVKDFGLAVCSVVCFTGVVLAWYGVNFIFGTGKHAYGGAGAGDNRWLLIAGLTNLSLVLHAAVRYQGRGEQVAALD